MSRVLVCGRIAIPKGRDQMSSGAQPVPEASTRSFLNKIVDAIEQENTARSEISATVADLGDWITTVDVPSLPEQIRAVILVDRATGRQRLFYEYKHAPTP
jgi:hypothetical protein